MPDFGSANTGVFSLSEASIFIGPQADLYKLNESNRIGLTKSFNLKSDVGYVELTEGILNLVVDSQMNKSNLTSSFEVYEYTSKNLAYSLGLDGSTLSPTGAATTIPAGTTGTSETPEMTVTVASPTGITAGKWVVIQGPEQDQMYFDEVASVVTDAVTLTYGVPETLASATMRVVNPIDLGSSKAQPYLSLKAVGQLTDGSPMGVLVPKLRITKGFALALTSKQHGNLPFETTVYRPVSTDPFFSDFSNRSAIMFVPT